jgi:hypothetical protein
MTKDEALKLALEVLEDLPGFRADIDNAIAAIKEALAQPALERNFCSRCGKRTWDIHTCTAPQENT